MRAGAETCRHFCADGPWARSWSRGGIGAARRRVGGLRDCEIVRLTWGMVLYANGQVGPVLDVRAQIAKRGGGARGTELTATHQSDPKRTISLQSICPRDNVGRDNSEHEGIIHARPAHGNAMRLPLPLRAIR